MAILMFLLCGCRENTDGVSSSETVLNTSASAARDYLTLLYSSSDTFNPYTATTEINRQLCKLLYEPLIKLDNEFNLHYCLAEIIEETMPFRTGSAFLLDLRLDAFLLLHLRLKHPCRGSLNSDASGVIGFGPSLIITISVGCRRRGGSSRIGSARGGCSPVRALI